VVIRLGLSEIQRKKKERKKKNRRNMHGDKKRLWRCDDRMVKGRVQCFSMQVVQVFSPKL